MTIKGGSNKACASCKYQRRRCSKECVLAPYFPADQPKKFQNAHRLFGVSNIGKILKVVEPDQKDEAMESIIFESNMRARYPVHGCLGVILQYNQMLLNCMEELRQVKTHLAICKEHFRQNLNPSYHLPPPVSPPDCSVSSQQLGFVSMPSSSDNPLIYNHFQHSNENLNMVDEIGVYNTDVVAGGEGIYNGGSGFVESEDDLKPLNIVPQSNFIGNEFANQRELDFSADYDDLTFDAIADDRQSFIGCKELCESSAESSFRDATQHVSNNIELRSAAAYFSLTNVK